MIDKSVKKHKQIIPCSGSKFYCFPWLPIAFRKSQSPDQLAALMSSEPWGHHTSPRSLSSNQTGLLRIPRSLHKLFYPPQGFLSCFSIDWSICLPWFFLKLFPQASSLNVNFLNASYDTLLPNLNPINFPLSGFLLGPHFLAPEPDKNEDSINRE